MKTALIAILCLAVAVGVFLLGRVSVRERTVESEVIIRTDTLWTTVHDTTVLNTIRTRTLPTVVDTVWLRVVDTLMVSDTVRVEVPLYDYHFTGDHWAVDARGWGVTLGGVWFDYPTIATDTRTTRTRYKRWAFTAGAQLGYGYTVHGGSPYIGVGVGFGYVF